MFISPPRSVSVNIPCMKYTNRLNNGRTTRMDRFVKKYEQHELKLKLILVFILYKLLWLGNVVINAVIFIPLIPIGLWGIWEYLHASKRSNMVRTISQRWISCCWLSRVSLVQESQSDRKKEWLTNKMSDGRLDRRTYGQTVRRKTDCQQTVRRTEKKQTTIRTEGRRGTVGFDCRQNVICSFQRY